MNMKKIPFQRVKLEKEFLFYLYLEIFSSRRFG